MIVCHRAGNLAPGHKSHARPTHPPLNGHQSRFHSYVQEVNFNALLRSHLQPRTTCQPPIIRPAPWLGGLSFLSSDRLCMSDFIQRQEENE